MTAAGLLLFACAAVGGEPKDWTECPARQEYAGEKMAFAIEPDGRIVNVRHAGTPIISQLMLHGSYASDGQKYDRRFFQNRLAEAQPLLTRTDGETVWFRKQGVLANDQYPRAASFSEEVRATPRALELRYEVELLVPLSSPANLFMALAYLPPAALAGRGYRQTQADAESSLKVFPAQYERGTSFGAFSLLSLRVVMAEGHLLLAAGEASRLALSDTRSYGGPDLRVDFQPAVTWRAQPVRHEAGEKFIWSFRLAYLDDLEKEP